MNTKLWIGIGIIVLLGVGVLTNIIGGVSIRSNDTSTSRITLQVVQPLHAGATTIIRWDTPSFVASQQVIVDIRSKQGRVELSQIPFFAGTASIQIPCSVPAGSASLELIGVQDKSLIAWKTITISPAGADCVQ